MLDAVRVLTDPELGVPVATVPGTTRCRTEVLASGHPAPTVLLLGKPRCGGCAAFVLDVMHGRSFAQIMEERGA